MEINIMKINAILWVIYSVVRKNFALKSKKKKTTNRKK